ncbi:hypothetical protein D3C71_1879780 [compost metagenome]
MCARLGNIHANVTQLLFEPFGVVMIFFQPLDVVLQGIEPGSRQNTGLAHTATGHLAPAVGTLNKLFATA